MKRGCPGLGGRGTLPCRANDTGVLYEMFSRGGGALPRRVKSKQLKERSLSSEAYDTDRKDLLLALESMKTSFVSFFCPGFVLLCFYMFLLWFSRLLLRPSLDRCR